MLPRAEGPRHLGLEGGVQAACCFLVLTSPPRLCRQPPEAQPGAGEPVGPGDAAGAAGVRGPEPHQPGLPARGGVVRVEAQPPGAGGRGPPEPRGHLPLRGAGGQEQPEGAAAPGEPFPGRVPALPPERSGAGQRYLQLPRGGVAAQPRRPVVQTGRGHCRADRCHSHATR